MKRLFEKIRETKKMIMQNNVSENGKNYLEGKLQGLLLAQAIFYESEK